MRDLVVIVTGASKGIGAELARQLAPKGVKLALAARSEAELATVAEECRKLGAAGVITVKCDVAVEHDCQTLATATLLAFGRIDILVNNAGASMWARFDEIKDLTVLDRLMRVNYMGSVFCTAYALPHLRETKGRIVGIASLAGMTGVPTRTGYSASKHAMRGFFDSLRIELAESGVTVTMIYPGFVATGIRENATGPDGKPILVDPVKSEAAMSVEECVRRIVQAIEGREREVIMTARAKMGLWLKLIAPRIVDRIARKAVEEAR